MKLNADEFSKELWARAVDIRTEIAKILAARIMESMTKMDAPEMRLESFAQAVATIAVSKVAVMSLEQTGMGEGIPIVENLAQALHDAAVKEAESVMGEPPKDEPPKDPSTLN